MFAGGNVGWQVSIMFATLEKIAQTDPKYADIFLFENYAAFQNRQVFPSSLHQEAVSVHPCLLS